MNSLGNLKGLIERYNQDIEFYRSTRYNETQLRTDFIDQFFAILGWDITNVTRKSTHEREVLVEEGIRFKSNENTKKPDYTFRLFSERKFFVEAKNQVFILISILNQQNKSVATDLLQS